MSFFRFEDRLGGKTSRGRCDLHPEPGSGQRPLPVLTDGKRVSVINAPAGSGKTRVMTEAARVWAAAGRTMPRGRHMGEAAGAGRGRGARIAAALGLSQLYARHGRQAPGFVCLLHRQLTPARCRRSLATRRHRCPLNLLAGGSAPQPPGSRPPELGQQGKSAEPR